MRWVWLLSRFKGQAADYETLQSVGRALEINTVLADWSRLQPRTVGI
jgi:hypothetical protein